MRVGSGSVEVSSKTINKDHQDSLAIKFSGVITLIAITSLLFLSITG